MEVTVENDFPASDALTRFGYVVNRGSVANLTAIGRNVDGTVEV